jgi:polyphosphate kinase 2 (PPK2 family)
MNKRYLIKPGARVRLRDFDPDDSNGLEQSESTKRRADKDLETLSKLQELLCAARANSVLVVLQGSTPAAGRHHPPRVLQREPAGCHVASFKVPTEPEGARLPRRVHAHRPALATW